MIMRNTLRPKPEKCANAKCKLRMNCARYLDVLPIGISKRIIFAGEGCKQFIKRK